MAIEDYLGDNSLLNGYGIEEKKVSLFFTNFEYMLISMFCMDNIFMQII